MYFKRKFDLEPTIFSYQSTLTTFVPENFFLTFITTSEITRKIHTFCTFNINWHVSWASLEIDCCIRSSPTYVGYNLEKSSKQSFLRGFVDRLINCTDYWDFSSVSHVTSTELLIQYYALTFSFVYHSINYSQNKTSILSLTMWRHLMFNLMELGNFVFGLLLFYFLMWHGLLPINELFHPHFPIYRMMTQYSLM